MQIGKPVRGHAVGVQARGARLSENVVASTMTSRLLPVLWGLALSFILSAAQAVSTEDLYEAEVEVSARQADLPPQAVQQALDLVLVRISGRPTAPEDLRGQRPPGSHLVQQYAYRTRSDGQMVLWIRFHPEAVDQLLSSRGLPVWEGNRPALMVWLAIDEAGRRSIVGADDRPALEAALRAAARERGLPVYLPLLDMEDLSKVAVEDIWSNWSEPLQAASARYRVDAMLVGRLTRYSDSRWGGDWTLYLGGEQKSWETGGGEQQVMGEAVNEAADFIARRFAPTAEAGLPEQVQLTVVGIDNFRDFAEVLRYLSNLGPVRAASPFRVEPSSVTFDVRMAGLQDDLDQAVTLGNVLAPTQGEPGGGAYYRLLH